MLKQDILVQKVNELMITRLWSIRLKRTNINADNK